jgi:hypothetical protein
MRWRTVLSRMLVPAGVPLGILILLVVVQFRPAGSENVVGVRANPDGGALMLDPQGDPEMARHVMPYSGASGTPQVILSRKVLGSELPCLGFSGFGSLESRPADSFGLVVLGGDIEWNFPATVAFRPGPFPYMAYLYDLRYSSLTAASVPPEWPSLRAAFGGPAWP